VSLLQPETRGRLASMQQYFMAHGLTDPAAAMHQAVIAIGHAVRAQATVMGYSDCFGLLGVALLGAMLSVALLRKGAASGGGAH
jgi:DHA2 family multidrug resistance protein